MTTITIGIADFNIVKPPNTLITYALGSCIGICLYDPTTKIAGMAHIMLPLSSDAVGEINRKKYADTCTVDLITKMERAGAKRSALVAKIAGGAQMFAVKDMGGIMDIGKRNHQATLNTLQKLNIRLISSDCGSNYGRTIEFFSETGELKVKSIAYGTKII